MKRTIALLMAAAMLFCFAGCGDKDTDSKPAETTGAGTYSDLAIMKDVELGVEEYGISFRKGSDMVAKVDEITAEFYQDGTIAKLAEKYDQKDSLVPEFKASTDSNPTGESDFEYIKKKGTLVIGVTVYDPMNYKDENGKWIGFDTEYAEAVAAKLGVKAEFKEIVWENKVFELDGKTIDCIWNGMTITDDIIALTDVTGAYMKNYQVVVTKAGKFDTLESLKGKTVVAEGGSAGEEAAKADENLKIGYKKVESQADALLNVKSGQADACVIDYIMANSMVGK